MENTLSKTVSESIIQLIIKTVDNDYELRDGILSCQ